MLPPFDPWLCGVVAGDVAVASYAGAQALASRRVQRLRALLASAARGSRLYRRLLKDRDLSATRLQDLPVMHKADLMRQFDDWVTDPELKLDDLRRFVRDRSCIAEPFLGRYMVWESSGSGGEPGIFVQDASAMAVYDALEALRRPPLTGLQRAIDPMYLGERIVFVGATNGHFASTVSMERLRRIHPTLSGNVHGVSFLQPTDRLVAELHAQRPTIIATYPSAAILLAEERAAGRLKVDLHEVWTGGETLAPCMRRFVRDAFGCPVSNNYGASEFLSLASECRCGHLHLNSDWAILESVDETGQVLPPNVAGAGTLLTNLANLVQPLIRYDLGDRVSLHREACECGSHLPVIDVQGRCDDSLQLGPPGASAVRVLPLALSTVLEDDADLFDFQIVQEGPNDLLLCTALEGQSARSALHRGHAVLDAFLKRQGALDVHIRCRSGQPGQRGRTGKVKRVLVQTA